jgi:hypothetical protein
MLDFQGQYETALTAALWSLSVNRGVTPIVISHICILLSFPPLAISFKSFDHCSPQTSYSCAVYRKKKLSLRISCCTIVESRLPDAMMQLLLARDDILSLWKENCRSFFPTFTSYNVSFVDSSPVTKYCPRDIQATLVMFSSLSTICYTDPDAEFHRYTLLLRATASTSYSDQLRRFR